MIPFSTSNEFKKAASQVNLSIDLDNLQSPLENAEDEIRDLIGDEAYEDITDHYENPPEETDADMDTLLRYLQSHMAHITLYNHFIFLQISISNSGVKTYKSDDATTAYKYQTDEAKEKLLITAWKQMSRLIDKMNSMEYIPWWNSDQYTESKELLFENYRDFNKYFDIGRNAAFYIRCRYLIKNEVQDIISAMNIDVTDISDDKLKNKVKMFAAYKTIELAIMRFDYPFLPETIRSSLSNELNKKHRDSDKTIVREKVSSEIAAKAGKYLREIQLHQDSQGDNTLDAEYMNENYSDLNDPSKKYFNGI